MLDVEVARFGGPEVLAPRDLRDPTPGPGQVTVAASASDVLFVDTLIRAGRARDYFPIRPPYVPGNGVGGEVVAVGEGVDPGWFGRQVVAHTGGPGGTGGYAERATADLESVAAVPEGVGLLTATAVLHDGTTALRILEQVDTRPWAVLDGVGGRLGAEAFRLLAEGGWFSAQGSAGGSFAAFEPEAARHRGIAVTTIADLRHGPDDRPRLLRAALDEVHRGRLRPYVGQTFPLAEASKAHQALEARETVAKTLLLSA